MPIGRSRSCPSSTGARALAARPLVDRFPDFDAIFAASDMIAIAAIANLRAAGIDVPGDVSVVGFDDIRSGAHVSPALTTIHQQIPEAGRAMVEAMVALLLDTGEPGPVRLDAPLVIRQSCGARPEGAQPGEANPGGANPGGAA